MTLRSYLTLSRPPSFAAGGGRRAAGGGAKAREKCSMLNSTKSSNIRWVASLALTLFLSGLTAQAAIYDGLVAYWSFDGNLRDTINGFHGTARGTNDAIPFVAGKASLGQAIQLDGTDQFVEITGGNENELEFPGGSMSILGWFKVDTFDTEWQCLISKGEGENYRVARRALTDKVAYAGGVGEAGELAPAINDGQWHQFVAISDATCCTKFYVDGVLYEQTTAAPVLAQSAFNLMIGENPGARNREWNGELDEFAIWNRVVTEEEIAGLWAAGAGSPLSVVLSEDADGDGLPNIWELNNGLDPNVSNIGVDTDGDGLLDTDEFILGTRPNNVDTDGDGYQDGAETGTGVWVNVTDTGTSPLSPDTDGDGLLDGVESNTGLFVDAANTGSSPLVKDTDSDYTPDGDEVRLGTDPTTASSAPALGDGLIANWPFDGNLLDPVGGHNGIGWAGDVQIDPLYEPAKFGDGALLSGPAGIGAEEYIEAGGPESDFDRAGGSVTISGWFKVGSFDTDWQALVAKGEGSNYRVARSGSGTVMAYAGGSGDISATTPVNDGELHHFVAVSRAGVQSELWIDGVREAVGAAPSIANNDQPLLIGGNPEASPRRHWNGVVDDFAIWSRALTPAEIDLIWNGGAGATVASLLTSTPAQVTGIGLNFGADEPVSGPASGSGSWLTGSNRRGWSSGGGTGQLEQPEHADREQQRDRRRC